VPALKTPLEDLALHWICLFGVSFRGTQYLGDRMIRMIGIHYAPLDLFDEAFLFAFVIWAACHWADLHGKFPGGVFLRVLGVSSLTAPFQRG